MLAWLSDHLLEMKVEHARGVPPRLEDAEAWFRFFDYDGKGRLSKPGLLRGVAKAYDVAALASPRTPKRRARGVGMQKLRDLVEAVWDDAKWEHGIPLCDFEGPNGLGARLLAALPDSDAPRCVHEGDEGDEEAASLTVQEALARARASDFEGVAAEVARAKERAEARQRKALTAPAPPPLQTRQGAPRRSDSLEARAGRYEASSLRRQTADLVLARLLEGASVQNVQLHLRPSVMPVLRIQCPFCAAVNEARAGPGNRIVCGRCRSLFAVP